MSRFPEGGLPGALRKNTNPARTVALTGTTETRNAPGLVALPAVSSGLTRANQLAQALGTTQQAAFAVTRASAIDAERAAAEEARAASQLRGQADLDARTALPELQQGVSQGELDALLDGEGDIEDAAREYLESRLRDDDGNLDVPEAYAEAYRRNILPTLTRNLVERQSQLIQTAKSEALQLDAEAAIGATDTETIREAIESSRNYLPDLSDTERLDAIVTPALRSAAAAGDEQRFDVAAAALGDRFPGMVADLRRELTARQNSAADRDRAEINNTLNQSVSAELLQDTPNFDRARELVAEVSADPTTRRRALTAIESAERRQQTESQALALRNVQDAARALASDPSIAPEDFTPRIERIARQNGIEPDAARDIAVRFAQQGITFAAQRGDVQRVDEIAALLGPEPDVQTFALTQRQEAVERFRLNAVDQMVGEALAQPDAAPGIIDRAQQGLAAFNADRSDPAGLRPEQFRRVLNASVAQSVQATQRDLETATLRGLYGQAAQQIIDPSTPTPPQAQVSREAVLQVWGEAGVAEVTADGDRAVLRRVPNPERAAVLTHLAGGVPAAGWYEQIGSGFDLHNNAEAVEGSQLFDSSRALLALHRQNPAFAQEVIRRHVTTEAGKQRADLVLAIADQRVGSLARPLNEAELIDAGVPRILGGTTAREEAAQELAAVVRAVGSTEPVRLDDKTIRAIITADTGGSLDDLADQSLRSNLPEGFQPTTGILFGRRLDFGRDTDFGPVQAEVREEYKRNLLDAFKSRKALGEADNTAATNARAVAAARTMAEFPPIQWADEIVFTRGGALIPDFDTFARRQFEFEQKNGRLDQGPDSIFANYVPLWDDNANGWRLVSRLNAEVPLLNNAGNPVVIVPNNAYRESLEKHVAGLLENVDDIAAKKQVRDNMKAATTRLIFMPGL